MLIAYYIRLDEQTEILIDSSGAYYEVSAENPTTQSSDDSTSKNKLHQAQISLNDCLACRWGNIVL